MEPKWDQNGAQIGQGTSQGRCRKPGRKKDLSGSKKIGHFGAHGRILSKLGAALGAILENVDFEGGPKIVIFEAKST